MYWQTCILHYWMVISVMSIEKLWKWALYKFIYHRHMGYVDKSDCMWNPYSISRWTWKWTKKLFFHLLDLTILNSFIILTSCGSKWLHWQFKLKLVRDLIQGVGRVPRPQTARQRRQAPTTSQPKRFDLRHNRHWLMQCKRIRCCVFSAKNKETRTKYKCQECNISVCATPCFKVYHTKPYFWETTDM